MGADMKADEVNEYRCMRCVSSSVSDVAWHASTIMAVRSHVLWCSLITYNVHASRVGKLDRQDRMPCATYHTD